MWARRTAILHSETSSRRALVAACVGNAVEWYDFAVYAALGVVVTPIFFPTEDRATTLLAAFAVYATAFVVRPLGAVLFGRRGDSQGRREVLVTVVLIMTCATAAVGLLPGHATIGLLAPCALILLRAAQGLAAGGELGVAAVFIAEHAPKDRRGGFAAWHTATLAIGVAAGLGVGGLLALLPAEDLRNGWWRLAFLLAIPLGLVGNYLRRRVLETPHFVVLQQQGATEGRAIGSIWADHRVALKAGFALIAAGSLAFNTFFVYLPNHVVATSGRTLPSALLLAVVGLIVGAGAALFFGGLSDRVGRRPVVFGCVTALALLAVPMTLAAQSSSWVVLCLVEVAAGAAVGGTLSIAMLSEMFPTELRATGLSLTAGLAAALIGGTAPLFDQILFTATGLDVAPGLYVAVVAFLALAGLRSWPETAFEQMA